MTTPELLVALGVVLLVATRWWPAPARWAAAVALAGATVVLLTDLRWQMVPIVAAVVAGCLALRFRLAGIVALVLVAAGAGAAWAAPVATFPQPSGPYPVGTTTVHWTGERSLMVQLWFPARGGGRGAPYLGRTGEERHLVSYAVAGYFGVPGFALDSMTRARTHAVPDAPVAAGRFPVVLFSHGLGGVRTQNTAYAEELAGRGYVVASVDHPGDAAVVVYPDGRTVYSDITGSAAQWTAVRAADLSFVLDQLAAGAVLNGSLDLTRVAATGHSMGGASALRAARQDHRITAVVDLDGAPHDPEQGPYPQPVLALTQDHPADAYLRDLTRTLELSEATTYRLTIPGYNHVSFTDAPLFMPPLKPLTGAWGRVAPVRTTAAATAAFLDTTLRSMPVDLPALLDGYGDLTVHEGTP
ncbi:alpha/beta hydrolase family protein [Actinoplanes sp. NPDC051494]|uniref:alpha/beta hydrolase family protein n=1 Tax=Actinoplanes sp. NPDC051494 TaxID=3363907 RepID=UPI0037B65AB9